MLGKTAGVIGGAMYSQYCAVNVAQCLPLREGTAAAEGASWFVNPLTGVGANDAELVLRGLASIKAR